jgi:hypothetical protein
VKIEGLQVKGWHRYAIAQLTLLGGPDVQRPLFRVEEGTVSTGQAISATFLRGTVDVGDEAAVAAWRQFLERPAAGRKLGSSLELTVHEVRPEGGLPEGAGIGPADLPPLDGRLTVSPLGRQLNFSGWAPSGKFLGLTAHAGSSLSGLGLSPPTLLGVERLARSLGWPGALVPANLDGGVVLVESPGLRSITLKGAGTLHLAEVASALGLPDCSGEVSVKIDLESGFGPGPPGTVSVALAGSGPATVDPLALEVFRYIFFGQLSDRAVEEDVYTLDRIAFTVTLAGDRVTVTGEDGPLLSGRSQRGYTIELSGPAQASTEELARRLRLALGGLPSAGSPEVGESRPAPPGQ